MDPNTEFEIGRAQEMHQFVAEQLVGKYPTGDDDQRALFASFLSLVQSHHEAIMVLCREDRLVGSAYALFRPLVEVASRGLFIAFLATPDQIEAIKRGSEKPYGHFNDLVKRIDARLKTNGQFTRFGGESWKMMNGLTHGGLEQLNRRIGDDGMIGCYFEPEDVQRLIVSSTSVLVQTAEQFLRAMDRNDARDSLLAKNKSFYSNPIKQ